MGNNGSRMSAFWTKYRSDCDCNHINTFHSFKVTLGKDELEGIKECKWLERWNASVEDSKRCMCLCHVKVIEE